VLVARSAGTDRLRRIDAQEAPGGAPAVAREGEAGREGLPAVVRLRALASATVDLERAAAGLGGLGDALPDDALLGARIVTTATARVVLAEPLREGRLAATLARHGEGPAALYVAVPGAAFDELRSRVVRLGEGPRDGDGPFGRQLLARTRPAWGPHLLLVPEDATRERPVAGRSDTIAP
jgi:hypothetical protein